MTTLIACSDRAGNAPAVAANAPPLSPHAEIEKVPSVIFLGTSLTAGYGVGPDVAFPARIQQLIDSAGLHYRVANAGLSGETSAGGLRRIDWVLQNPVDVFVLELGANDGLRGLDTDSMRHNLDDILSRVRTKYPDAAIVIAGMEAPPNLGTFYTGQFRRTYSWLANKYDATLIPFLLEGVAGNRELNQEDGIHPNAAGHRAIAHHVWQTLQPILAVRARPDSLQ